jgi:tRNA(Ile)-lysidine synthase
MQLLAMKKTSSFAYRSLFLKHVFQFLSSVTSSRLLGKSHVIAVSGGVDSMALLWLATQLHFQDLIGPIRAVFVHHQTRDGQDLDAKLVKDFCLKHNINFTLLHAQGLNDGGGNFEYRARVARRNLLIGNLSKNELLWLGHHLDDSFEWGLMQKYRSANLRTSLGIPVRNGRVLRPFMCVSKRQIRHFARLENIIFREDPTNKDLKFDRNFVREKLSPLIQERYPQFLKHYVGQANTQALLLKMSLLSPKANSRVYTYRQGAVLRGEKFSSDQVLQLLHTYSLARRGKLSSQVLKMLKAIENGKKGPFHFSGGTEAYFTPNLLMIYQQNFQNSDDAVARILKTLTDEQLKSFPKLSYEELDLSWNNLLQSPQAIFNMPGLLLVMENLSVGKILNTSVHDSLFPEVSNVIQQRHFRLMTTQKCLEVWRKKKSKLPEKLGIVPLWTLSNLFPSQE